jgi:hypothetical protein
MVKVGGKDEWRKKAVAAEWLKSLSPMEFIY